MQEAVKPFLILLLCAGIGLGIAVVGGHKLGAAAVAKHNVDHGSGEH